MARLLSVKVGLPEEGNSVRTAIWKSPVEGRRIGRTVHSAPRLRLLDPDR